MKGNETESKFIIIKINKLQKKIGTEEKRDKKSCKIVNKMEIVSTFLSIITLNVIEFTFISKSKDKEWLKHFFKKQNSTVLYSNLLK